ASPSQTGQGVLVRARVSMMNALEEGICRLGLDVRPRFHHETPRRPVQNRRDRRQEGGAGLGSIEGDSLDRLRTVGPAGNQRQEGAGGDSAPRDRRQALRRDLSRRQQNKNRDRGEGARKVLRERVGFGIQKIGSPPGERGSLDRGPVSSPNSLRLV